MRILAPPALPYLMVLAAALSGCGSKIDVSTSISGDTGGNVAAGGHQAGADQGTSISSTADTTSTTGGASNGGAGNTGGAGNVGNAGNIGGALNTGGTCATGSRKSMPGIGGTTVRGTAVCNSPNVCGTVLDANDAVYDCGFKNCPQEVCGKNAPNQCPPACSNKITCSSDDCGLISDGCGGTIDCGYTNCPKAICGQKAPNQCPTGCTSRIDCKSDCGTCCTTRTCPDGLCGKVPDGCGGIIDCPCTCVHQECPAGACGKYPDGCGGELDCGPCCTPFTCEDWCPAYNCGNIRECSATKDDINRPGATYICPCPKPDGCASILDCWCPCG